MNALLISTFILTFIWLVALSVMYQRQQHFFKKFTEGVSKKDLKESLQYLTVQLQAIKKSQRNNAQTIATMSTVMTTHFQKMGFMRFNPYADTGGDQSFCVCLLNSNNTGVIITSLHSREQTRIYAKDIRNGNQGEHILSKEEEQVLAQAIHSSL